ncbi:hypothetical protein QUF64_00150 [Anaerolineales bacterium HSG6]|nr:hypothetical protein [Anaerolineales bacterium HSG6]MDM8531714.1 hypothetical protein [Anaerolineales bacterium HSG25]
MNTYFTYLIELLAGITVVITGVRAYLSVNKKWKWKHDQVVTDSISVFAYVLGLAWAIPFLLKFTLIDQDFSPAMITAITIVRSVLFLLIGMGFWVTENQKLSFWKLLVKSFNLERQESTGLIKAFIYPTGAEQLLIILEKVAAIDNDIEENEIELIHQFAKQWNLDPPELQVGPVENVTSLLDLRQSVLDYLELSPSVEQAGQLTDMIELMVKADGKITSEEALILAELTGLINEYIQQDDSSITMFEVLLVPQKETEIEALRTILPWATFGDYRGGVAFAVGKFYSSDYAKAIADKYTALGTFTTTVEC